jgi:hypothetical protein
MGAGNLLVLGWELFVSHDLSDYCQYIPTEGEQHTTEVLHGAITPE